MSKARNASRFPPPRRGLWAAAAIVLLCLGNTACAREDCSVGPRADAARNAASLNSLAWAPFHRPEAGWATYEPLVAREIATACPPTSPGFAAALARWRGAHGLRGPGVLDAPTFSAMYQAWQARRPFVVVSKRACPAPPAVVAQARKDEGWSGKPVSLRLGALGAYRKMVAAARAQIPALAADRQLMTMFSGYRSPAYDAERCARQHNCQGVTRAVCSAHRTGLAVDLFFGNAPGQAIDSSDNVNRLYISRTAGYLWMVKNADRYGFVNYAFEPWHWEWTGEPP
jgi:hypothetical protein